MPRPWSEQHLVRRPDSRQQGESRAAALHGQPEAREEEAADHRRRVLGQGQVVGRQARHRKDLRATWQIFINPANNVISRTGWEDVKSIKGSGKKASSSSRIVRRLGGPRLERRLPGAHHPGQDMNKMFLTSIPVSSGPWRFDSWQKGVQLAVRKNAASRPARS